MTENTLYWYGRTISDMEKEKLTSSINTVYVDNQNYENCHSFLLAKGFQLSYEGYQLTSNNDLYQYCYIR